MLEPTNYETDYSFMNFEVLKSPILYDKSIRKLIVCNLESLVMLPVWLSD